MTARDTPEIAAIREIIAVLDRDDWQATRWPQAVASLRTLLAAHDARESAPSVEVRIAVGVAPDGRWSATGWSEAEGDDEIADAASEGLDALVGSVHFIIARVPLPVSMEIKGRVE